MAILTKKGTTYYAIFSYNGKSIWKRIGKVSYKDAMKAKHFMESEVDKGNLGLLETNFITFYKFQDPCQAPKAGQVFKL